ncbi:Transcriptional activator CadC [Tsuneonella dongtanensis]|uniref:Transcriptional activator CadC n=1 Tax=Tsuneonella dongtanensis TaxID=692370 RepID=A0A1B2AE96_9SPHN|nr:transcriptional regulator [Tsuneonella dongtanensis]ANY20456.1 Transcriptional activator CadC [Tsuneonella dongtanensis]
MSNGAYRFGPFRLDPEDRRLTRDGEPVEVSARYLDALILLAAEGGRLVTKDRFMDEVWRGVPVTDEALTQCIRALRKALGDDAAAPRYIETVPRHGYRLVAALGGDDARTVAPLADPVFAPTAFDGFSAALGGGLAGIAGGLGYLALGLVTPGIGTASTLLVLVSMNLLLGAAAGLAVGGAAAFAAQLSHGKAGWIVVGGAVGGLLVGAIGRMLGNDLFALLFGRAPGAITGAVEGLILGAVTGISLALALRAEDRSAARRLLPGFAFGGAAGLIVALAGGRLMAGSLAELSSRFPDSNLQVGGALFGENGFGPIALSVVTACEGALFCGCVVAAIVLGRRLRAAG